MQRDLPRQRGAAAGFTFETPLENEGEILDGLLAALARNQLPPETWSSLHLAAIRDDRLGELAAGYGVVAQGKRIKAAPPQAGAEFLYRAALFFVDAANDPAGAVEYLQRALAVYPAHVAAFERLEAILVDAGERKAQADLYIAHAHHIPRSEQADLLRRAVSLLEGEPDAKDQLIDQCQEILRLDPRDDDTRGKLETLYLEANRPRDVVRLLEQSLASDPPPSDYSAQEIRARLIHLYAGPLAELERTMPHVEALLLANPEHEEARTLAQRLLEVKALAGRAAAALAQAIDATGTPQDVAKILAIELEHTRGPKRRDVLRRLGLLRQDRLGDDAGAYEAFEQALSLDSADDEVRGRFVALAMNLHKEMDAARSLARFGAAARDPHVRARLSTAVGQLYLAAGDPKRARASFVGVLAMPDLPQDVALSVSRTLSAIYASERDFPTQAATHQRVALLEPDPDLQRVANEELAELAQNTLRDAARAIAAWRRLIDTSARERALNALEPLYEATGNVVDLAFVLEERAKDQPDEESARALAFRAAAVLTSKPSERERASEAWARFYERFGADREALGAWIPLLEAAGDWHSLSTALEGEATLASDDERPALFAKLGQNRLQRTGDLLGAIRAFADALDADPAEATSRAALEHLSSAGTERLAAALVLEPHYRRENDVAGILRVLDLKASSSPSAGERLDAIVEALHTAESAGGAGAVDWIARGLNEAVAARRDVGPWIQRLDAALGQGELQRCAEVLRHALGDLAIDSPQLSLLSRRAAEAHVSSGHVALGLAFYQRALAYEPGSPELLARVDDLLREQGTPSERVALYRAALEQNPPPPRRRELLHTIAFIQRQDMGDKEAATATYESAVLEDPSDHEAVQALGDLYAETARWGELLALLGRSLAHASVSDARAIRARMAEVAIRHGDAAEAREQARVLLDDSALGEPALVVLERVADALQDTTMLRTILERRAGLAGEPSEQIMWLDRLGALELSCADPDRAVATWKRGAEVAERSGDASEARRLYECAREVSPNDREAASGLADLLERAEMWSKLPELYAVLLEHSEAPSARINVLVRHAKLLADHLDDPGSALVSAAQAFELASNSSEYRDVLTTFTTLALRGKATHIFAQAMDDAIARHAGPDPERASRRAELRMAKARVLSANREGRDAAVGAYRAILEDQDVGEGQLKAALHAFEALLSNEPAEARRPDRRWLLEWRAERATGKDKAAALEIWAKTEEALFGDPDQALELYRRVQVLDPDNVNVLSAVARLSLGKGDAQGAVDALIAQRDQSSGAMRRAVDLEIAATFLHRLHRPDEALEAVARVLEDSPNEERALALATELLAEPATREAMTRVLETAERGSDDGAVRARILRALLDASSAAPRDVRRRWFDSLFEIERKEGRREEALGTVLLAAGEMPEAALLWDRAEELARELERPREVADAFRKALALPLPAEVATALGERGVLFQEEWFDDAEGVVSILERVLEIDVHAHWAFDRLKMLFDAAERWTELFALYDRTILVAEDARKASLYEDAAQIAKDFANDSDRAVGYLEKLLALRPSDAHLVASLERLYERKGAYRELVVLLTQQLASQGPGDAQRTRARIAQLWLDELKDLERAFEVSEEIRSHASSSGDQVDPFALLERVMAVAPRGQPGPEGAPKPVRYRAAAVLREHYERAGQDADLARLFTVELEIAGSPRELALGHRKIATFHAKLGDDKAALEHVAALVLLEPGEAGHRTELAELAARVGRYDRLADVLAQASEKADAEPLRSELMVAAGDVWVTHLRDEARAATAYLSVLSGTAPPKALVLDAARKVEPLLERAGRSWDLLEVLERLAALEDSLVGRTRAWTLAARLATTLGDHARAIAAWEARLREESDADALDALIDLLERTERWRDLLVALERRAGRDRPTAERRADRARIAQIQQDRIGDLEAAAAAWKATEDEFGATDESTDALSMLLEKTGRWVALEEKLESAAREASAPERRAALLAHRGDVARLHRDDPARARASYEAALKANPREPRARAGLHAMAVANAHRAEAVTALLAAFTATDDWKETLALSSLRLEAAEGDAARVAILRESAKIAEDRGEDPRQAFEFYVSAFLVVPDQSDVASELARLAAMTGEWQRYAEAHETVLANKPAWSSPLHKETLGDAVWRAGFRLRLGRVKDEHLSDADGALRVFEEAGSEAPADSTISLATIDVAARLARWGAVATALVRAARGKDLAPEAELSAAEQSAQVARAWDDLAPALAAEIRDAAGLTPKVARDLEARLGAWHRDRRGDPDAAESAFTRALAYDTSNTELLTSLAQLQRRAKGRPLVDSLLRLSEATGGDYELLREAAEVATATLADRQLAKSILSSLVALAEARWKDRGRAENDDMDAAPVSVGALSSPEPIIRWTISELVRIHVEEGHHERAVDLLASGARFPWTRDESRRMLHDAARAARDDVRDPDRAIALYEGLFDSDEGDRAATDALTDLYESTKKHAELLRLRARLVALREDAVDRIALRLASARLESSLGHPDAAITLLHANLVDSARHGDTVDTLAGVLEENGQFDALADLSVDQAELAAAAGEPLAAAAWWVRAATVAEVRLSDPERAVRHHRRALPLHEDPGSLDALARLLGTRGDHAEAALALGRLLRVAPADARSALTIRLVEELVAAGEAPRARQALEAAAGESPDDETLQKRLIAMYVEQGAWDALAELHRAGAEHAVDKGVKLDHLKQAADLFTRKCRTPDAAIPLLEQAAALDPDDRTTRLALADALVHAERFPEARSLLRAIIDGFAGRRPKERGLAHYHLALLELASGDRPLALTELDAATKIDPGNPRILRSLAELAQSDGQLDRAERSYRALLVALKKPEESSEDAPIVRSEVLLQLSSIAAGQGQADRARELLESALESGSKSIVEARRLEQGLRDKKDFPTLVRALEARLPRATSDAHRVEVLTELARVLDVELGHLASAFTARQKVLALTPGSAAAHEASLALARRVDGVARYLEDITRLAAEEETHGRREAASALYFRSGQALETEQGGDERALVAYQRALELADPTPEAPRAGASFAPRHPSLAPRRPQVSKQALATIRALDPVLARLGKTDERHRLLARRVEVESPEDEPKAAADARYHLAELTLTMPEGALEGGLLLTQALELDPDLTRAEVLVREGVKRHPGDEGLLDLFERIGRNAGREAALLDVLEVRALLPNASPDVAREASSLAKQLGDLARGEELLTKYVDKGGGEDVAWAFEELANLREASGDVAAAIGWKKRAAEVLVGNDARRLRFEMAKLTQEVLGDKAAAAALYEVLFDEDPSDKAAWEPMLAAYRALGDTASLVRVLPRVVDQLASDDERSRLRFERVRLMVDKLGQRDDAIEPLAELVADDPNFVEAAVLLADLFEQAGRKGDLGELLGRQIDAAKDKQDGALVEALSLRKASLLEEDDADEARATLYSALDWTPDSKKVLEHLLRLLQGEGMDSERLEIRERLLRLASPADAERVALELYELRTAEGNLEAAERALAVGYGVNPESRVLYDRLESLYRDASATSKLADLHAARARATTDPKERAVRLRESATLYAKLPDPRREADVLTEAFLLSKTDVALASELVEALVRAHDLPAALGVLTETLELTKDDPAKRATLLLERASVRVELGEDQSAGADLVAVARLGVIHVARTLEVELERLRARAEARGDAAIERAMRLELAAVRAESGDLENARQLVTDLLRREPKDREALRLVARIEERAERWDAATVAYRRLIPLEEGDLAVDTALRLADACERAGRLADARGALERTRTLAPQDEALRLRLERLYESVGAYRELAEMSFSDARGAADDATRCAHLKRAGALLLQDGTDADAAIDALVDAYALNSADMECTLLLADAYTVAGKTDEGQALLTEQITARGGKRSPELSSLYHRLARIAHATGDRAVELSSLTSALEADAQNGFAAGELASLALEAGDIEVATRALRNVTLLKDASTSHIPKALAYQYLGEIARQQGDPKRAMLLFKRAIEDDPSLESAHTLIEELRAEGG